MEKPQFAETVKVYFIEPIRSISVVMDVLIKLNFEVYSVPEEEAARLTVLLERHPRNVLYICLLAENAAGRWLAYIDAVTKKRPDETQFGVFVSSIINPGTRQAFLTRGVATIDLTLLQSNAVETLKKILLYFEAREKRKFVRARAFGVCQVFFKLKNLVNPIKGEIVELSIHAFSCTVAPDDKVFFSSGSYIPEVTLLLRGKRIKMAARFMGFDQADPNRAVLLICHPKVVNNQLEYHQQLPPEARKAVYDFILSALKEDIKRQLAEIEEKPKVLDTPELL
ncbi:MAG TPA: hypothetical protein ENN69_05000 [Spirochaetia bacterium]|nr:hypothetical protein [Spirochaetia bacterium]